MMLSLAQIKFLRRYQQKKVRDEERVFVAEGSKLIDELLSAFKCRMRLTAADVDLARLTLLKTPRDSWALFEKPSRQFESPSPSLLALAVDGVQDPGNLGTILRIADWFGINDIYCSQLVPTSFRPRPSSPPWARSLASESLRKCRSPLSFVRLNRMGCPSTAPRFREPTSIARI